MKKHILYISFFLFIFTFTIFSQISITSTGVYLQDFNTLSNSDTSSVLPDDWYFYETGSGADTLYTISSGVGTGGDTYSYGSNGNSERALGGLRTGSLIPSFGANFINNTGDVITLLHITYFGEQWRVGALNRTDADRLDFQYSTDATSLSDGSWNDVDQLDLLSPILNTTSGAKDGNLSGNRREVSGTITGLLIPNGAKFWIRWNDADISGSDDGLAIDDFEIGLTAPEVTQGGLLKFKSLSRNIFSETTDNQDTIVVNNYTGQPLKALQFNLLLGKTNGGLIFKSVLRGSAIPLNDFNFDYEIYPGDLRPDSSSIDTIKIVILGNETNAILPDAGDQDIMYFVYDVPSIDEDFVQTFNSLTSVKGATSAPVINANITSGNDEVINIIKSEPEAKLGDINLDNQVNLLDILLVIDYILGRADFTADQLANSDIFPWTVGEENPTPDGTIDVLDLAVLHNVVLTGVYPSGATLNKSISSFLLADGFSKTTDGMNAKLTFFISDEGITIKLRCIENVKGIQLELNQVNALIPENSLMSSVFNQASYHQDNSHLRLLLYDDHCTTLEPDEYLLASIPFKINDPEKIAIENVIVADENNSAMQKIEIEILYENPEIPADYLLHQNYPNPFNPSTLIRFSIPKDEFVTVKVFDMLGQEVVILFSKETKAGSYTINWGGLDKNGKQVSSGSYIYRMRAGDFLQSKKMIYIK